jgi:hypothetical protein
MSAKHSQYEELRRRAERTAPTRARAVVNLLDAYEELLNNSSKPNRKSRRRAAKHQGHPARTTSAQRRARWHDPSPQEAETREMARLVRKKHDQIAQDDWHRSADLLAACAAYVTPTLLKDFGLDKSHTVAWEHWLVRKLGEVLHEPDVEGYLAWRESCLEAVS